MTTRFLQAAGTLAVALVVLAGCDAATDADSATAQADARTAPLEATPTAGKAGPSSRLVITSSSQFGFTGYFDYYLAPTNSGPYATPSFNSIGQTTYDFDATPQVGNSACSGLGYAFIVKINGVAQPGDIVVSSGSFSNTTNYTLDPDPAVVGKAKLLIGGLGNAFAGTSQLEIQTRFYTGGAQPLLPTACQLNLEGSTSTVKY